MEQEKLEQLVADSMKSVFGFSLTRLGNVREAEELTSDILYKLLLAADRITDENRFYGYLWKTAPQKTRITAISAQNTSRRTGAKSSRRRRRRVRILPRIRLSTAKS